jgi:hypothetical protein
MEIFMILLIALGALFAVDNAEFLNTVKEQQDEGYTWKYVGKSRPSGTPAITIKPDNGDEFILWRLER